MDPTPQQIYGMPFPDKGLPSAYFRNLSYTQRTNFMFRRSVHFGAEGTLVGLPLIAVFAGMAGRGEKVPQFAAGIASTFAFPAIQAGASTLAIALIPGLGQGWALAVGLLTALGVSGPLENSVSRVVRTFTQFGEKQRRLEMGGNMFFSEAADQSRIKAQQELSGAFQPSRRFLGQEARFMHR